MNNIVLLIALATFGATLIGGLFALRLKDKLHLILGFSAGAIIAVALFEIIPEAVELGQGAYDIRTLMSVLGLGFLFYMVIDRFILIHHHGEEVIQPALKVTKIGKLGAGSLSLHSLLDGVAIGLAFQISPAIGTIVATAVLVHDFSDGINTVNLVLKNGGTTKEAFRWVIVDAITPVLGILSTFFFSLPATSLAILLATFAGFFLYIGAADLLPESHHRHPKKLTTIMTILGMIVIYSVVKIAG